MKKSDYEEFKDLIKGTKFELITQSEEDNDRLLVVSVKKDPWEGVGFVIPNFRSTATKLPYKLVSIKDGFAQVYCPYSGNGKLAQLQLNEVDPSTEQAYVEQLKKEAFERFGEIKEGDGFDGLANITQSAGLYANEEWDYIKKDDQLFFYNVLLYQQGKWVKRVPERVEASLSNWSWTGNSQSGFRFKFEFSIKNGGENIDVKDVGTILENYLDKYLNDSQK